MKQSLINKIIKQGVYLYGCSKKVNVVEGVDLFGKTYFIVTTKGFKKEPVLNEDDYGLTYSLKPF